MITKVGVCCYVKLLESAEKGERSWEVKLYTSGRLREVASRVKLPETPQLVERVKTTALKQGSSSSSTKAT